MLNRIYNEGLHLPQNRHKLLARIRSELIMRRPDTEDWIMIEVYERSFVSGGDWRASAVLPDVARNVMMREEIDRWWQGRDDFDVRMKWLVWVLTTTAA